MSTRRRWATLERFPLSILQLAMRIGVGVGAVFFRPRLLKFDFLAVHHPAFRDE